jgi:hypothetical protein
MKNILIALVLMLTFFTASRLFAEQLVCPDTVTVQESVTGAPEGWTPVSDGIPHPLKGVAFFNGQPEKKVGLAPDKETKKGGYLFSVWTFDAETAKNLWISCAYGRTAMTFARPVNRAYSQCTVKSDLGITVDGAPSLVSVECK